MTDKSADKDQLKGEIQEATAPVTSADLSGLVEGGLFEGSDPDINWVEGEGSVPRMISMTRPYKQSEATRKIIIAYKECNPEEVVVKPSFPMKSLVKPIKPIIDI